jgi:hypothetical protein
MKAYGMEVSGVFTFSEKGEMLVFSTEDRMAASMDGSLEQVPWSAECGEYVLQGRSACSHSAQGNMALPSR